MGGGGIREGGGGVEGVGLHNNNNNNNCLFTNPWKSEKEIKEVIPFWFNPQRSSAQMSNSFIVLFTIFDKLPPLYSFY